MVKPWLTAAEDERTGQDFGIIRRVGKNAIVRPATLGDAERIFALIGRNTDMLVPFMYVRRWFQLLFTNRESMHKGLDQIKHANPEEAERLRRIHKLAGIKK